MVICELTSTLEASSTGVVDITAGATVSPGSSGAHDDTTKKNRKGNINRILLCIKNEKCVIKCNSLLTTELKTNNLKNNNQIYMRSN